MAAVLRERHRVTIPGGGHKSPKSHPKRKARSRLMSHGSRAASRSNSRPSSRSNSLTQASDKAAAANAKAAFEMNKFSLKGLPPGEAMLARKQFRANSMDLSTELEGVAAALKEQTSSSETPTKAEDKVTNSSQPAQTGAVQEGPLSDPVLSRLRTEMGGKSSSDLGEAGPKRNLIRQEKRVADSLEVVNDAIAKLSALACDDEDL